jgi:hypothetical protein
VTPRVLDVESRPAGTPAPVKLERPLPVTNALGSMTRMGLGAVGMVVSTFSEARGRVVPGRNGQGPAAGAASVPVRNGLLRLLPGALLGAGFEAERRLLHASAAVEVRAIRVSSAVSRRVPGAPRSAVERSLVRWNERGTSEQRRNEQAMGEFVRRLAPELAEAIVARLPLEEIVTRIDMPMLTRRLLESIDLAGIVRESTATVGSDVVDAGRTQAMGADSFVERLVDRMLFRKEARDLEVDGP